MISDFQGAESFKRVGVTEHSRSRDRRGNLGLVRVASLFLFKPSPAGGVCRRVPTPALVLQTGLKFR